MTLDEALAELGIDHDAGSDGARRAYLRLLKTRKPETDPEGFMRLRAAYELVQSNLPYLEAFRSREPAPIAEPPPAEVEAVALNVETVSPAIEAVSPAIEHDESPPVEADEPVATEDLGDVDLMEALLARSAYAEAAEQALLILAAATARLDRPEPQVLSCLRLILGLHAIEAPAKAREVSAAFKAWLASSGQESARIRGQAAVLWALVRELNALNKGFPNRVRAPIARAALGGDLAQATADLTTFRRKQRTAACEAGEILRRKAPVIAAALADTLDPPPPAPVPSLRRSDDSRRGYGLLAILLIGMVRILIASMRESSDSSTSSRPTLDYAVPLAVTSLDAGDDPSARRELLRQNALLRGTTLWSLARSEGRAGVGIGDGVRAAVAAIHADDCAKLLEATSDIRAEAARTKQTIGPELGRIILLFDADADRYCKDGVDHGALAEMAVDAGPGDAGRLGRTGK